MAGRPLTIRELPFLNDVDDTTYVIVYKDEVFYKATLLQVWAKAWETNRYTSVTLQDANDPVNQANKFLGKMAFDLTEEVFVYASGDEPTDTWLYVSDNTLAHTPT